METNSHCALTTCADSVTMTTKTSTCWQAANIASLPIVAFLNSLPICCRSNSVHVHSKRVLMMIRCGTLESIHLQIAANANTTDTVGARQCQSPTDLQSIGRGGYCGDQNWRCIDKYTTSYNNTCSSDIQSPVAWVTDNAAVGNATRPCNTLLGE